MKYGELIGPREYVFMDLVGDISALREPFPFPVDVEVKISRDKRLGWTNLRRVYFITTFYWVVTLRRLQDVYSSCLDIFVPC